MSINVQPPPTPQVEGHSQVRDDEIEISIVMPCLNEAETIEACVVEALEAIRKCGVRGEVVIGDNGSTDGSQEIATRCGARVVPVAERGYGNALAGGIRGARGRFILMGDADDSYDFGDLPQFLERLRAGCDLVMGNRFRGTIHPGAMPWHHYYIGNPVLSGIGRLFFHPPAGDFHCGLRAFSKAAFERMGLRTTGMEFASEMVIKASVAGMKIDEVPVDLHPDGRSRPPHLRSFRDGWRHLRFMLLMCPNWLFFIPGVTLLALGILVSLFLIPGTVRVGGTGFGVHTLLVAGSLAIIGELLLIFAAFAQSFAYLEGLLPLKPWLEKWGWRLNLLHGVAAGAVLGLLGFGFLVAALLDWRSTGFGELDPRTTMRLVIPACLLLIAGAQTLFGSFLLSILWLPRKSKS